MLRAKLIGGAKHNQETMKIHKRYLIIFMLLLITEVAIAWFHFHRFIRGFLGDVLVIPLLYCLLKTFFPFSVKRTAYAVYALAIGIELLQLCNIVQVLGIKSKLLKTILGTVFDPWDVLAYTFGLILILIIEHTFRKK